MKLSHGRFRSLTKDTPVGMMFAYKIQGQSSVVKYLRFVGFASNPDYPDTGAVRKSPTATFKYPVVKDIDERYPWTLTETGKTQRSGGKVMIADIVMK